MSNPHAQSRLPVIPRLIRVLSLPITLGWAFVAVALGVLSPSLDDVASQHSVPMTPRDAPAFKSMMHIGDKFNEFHTDSTAMVVLEGRTNSATARTSSTTASCANCGTTISTSRTSRTSG